MMRLSREMQEGPLHRLTRRTTKTHAGMIAALPQLQGISIYATGTEWIDEVA